MDISYHLLKNFQKLVIPFPCTNKISRFLQLTDTKIVNGLSSDIIMDILNLLNVFYISMDILKEVFKLNEGSAYNSRIKMWFVLDQQN